MPLTLNLGHYIDMHLSYELATLAKATATWRDSRLGSRPYDKLHLEEMSQVAALVHVRTVCDFLGHAKPHWENDLSPHEAPDLPLWSALEKSVHERVLHPDPRRAFMPNARPNDDLQEKVFDLANEAFEKWIEVSNQFAMVPYRDVMRDVYGRAMASVVRLGMHPLF